MAEEQVLEQIQPAVAADAAEVKPGPEEAPSVLPSEPEGANGNGADKTSEPKQEVATNTDMPAQVQAPESDKNTNSHDIKDKQTTSDDVTQEKPETTQEDVEMTDALKPDDAAPAVDESGEPAVDTPASIGKSKARRKSGGIPEHKGKKLNKRASKAKMTHSDAKPGDYFYVRLKGYPLWPAIVCDESMLPSSLLKSRPVTAARKDGTYRDDYEDGGPKMKDRTFPVMYLHTNEFGWIPNYDLVDLDPVEVKNVPANMRKDLYAAHQLAGEQHDLQYFKDILQNFIEMKEAERAQKEADKAAKKAKKAAAKKEKKSAKIVTEDEEVDDVDMADADADADADTDPVAELESEEASAESVDKKTKRKLPKDTPQRPDSAKKPRANIKLNTTPKATNGTSAPKAAKEASSAKSAKPKTKKATPKTPETPEVVVPKEPELTAEEKRLKKEKEIMFLRHKLQKGLLTRDQDPKEDEMKAMSEFVTKLEGYADLEGSIIRATKINKVLKAILKLNVIPKEEEFQFKPRSQSLLDKWNKLLASEQGTPLPAPATTNGTNGEAKPDAEGSNASPNEGSNGTKEPVSEEKTEVKDREDGASHPEVKETPAVVESAAAPEEPAKESIVDPTPVKSTA